MSLIGVHLWKPVTHAITDIRGVGTDQATAIAGSCGTCRQPIIRVHRDGGWQHLTMERYVKTAGIPGRVNRQFDLIVFEDTTEVARHMIEDNGHCAADLEQAARKRMADRPRTRDLTTLIAELGTYDHEYGCPRGSRWFSRVP